MARVIISSGHTSASPGVVAFGLREYELARKIAKFALKYIRQAGIISLSTPPNLDLAQRIAWINNTGYNVTSNDIAIEIHINDGGKSGIEGWFAQDGNNPSEKLTNQVVSSICQDLSLPTQGIKSEFQHEMGSISFIHEVNPIASVIECCYIDNPEDAKILADDFSLEKIGRSIAKGIISYFGLNIELSEVIHNQPIAQPVANNQPIAFPQQNIGYTQPVNQFNQPAPVYSQPVASYQPVTYPQSTVVPQNLSQMPAPIQQPTYRQPINYQQPVANVSYPQQGPIAYPQQPAPRYNQGSALPYAQDDFVGSQNSRPISASQQLQQYQSYQRPEPPKPIGNSIGTTAEKPGFLPREERKEMIIRNYARILGRDPNENDLNYFLNTGIREDELLKKMVDSQEHADLVKARQEVITAKMKMTSEENELMTLRTKSMESDTIIKNLNDTLIRKNEAIYELNKKVKELEQKTTQSPTKERKTPVVSPKEKYKGNFSDRVFKAFSDILE